MSKKSIHGITVSTNNEHIDDDGYHRCNECETKTILVTPVGEIWEADEEPYKPGEEAEVNICPEIFVGELSGHWCPKCEMLVSLTYNFPM